MSGTDEEAPEHEEFMANLLQVQMRDTSTELSQVQTLLTNNAAAVKGATPRTYLEKELKAACSPSGTSSKLRKKDITNFQTCFNNTAAVQGAFNNMVVQVQLQDAVKQHVLDASKLGPQTMSVVSSSHECEELQKELGEVLGSIELRQQDILEKRLRLAAVHKRVSALWLQKQERDLTIPLKSDPSELKALRERLKVREGRIQVISHLLQTLVTGTSAHWGKNAQRVQVLQACELVNSRQTASLEQCQTIMDLLRR